MSETVVQLDPVDQTPAAAPILLVSAATAPAVGVIGLGTLGHAVALAMLNAGHSVLACDPDPIRCRNYAEFAGPDADVTDDPEEVGRRCGVVLLALEIGSDGATIHGALENAMAPGGVIIDMGPALPAELRRLAEELGPRGLHLADAPVLPGDERIVLLGGDAASVRTASSLLQPMGTCIPTGDVGSAQALAALIAELDEKPSVERVRELARR